MEELERVQERLGNIRAVEPILSALRTISLGSWRAALRQLGGARRYSERLLSILPLLLPALDVPPAPRQRPVPEPAREVVVVVGSERGLCGRFNEAVVELALEELAARPVERLELLALGSRAVRLLSQRGRRPAWSAPLSVTALPSPSLAFDLARRWLAPYEAHELDTVDVIYNHYRGPALFTPQIIRLIPPRLEMRRQVEVSWPPPIVETDPLRLYVQVVGQWAAVRFYNLLLESAAAEQSMRYQLMDGATKNAERLIEEMMMAVQTARRQAITRETQELAVGAGLVGRRST